MATYLADAPLFRDSANPKYRQIAAVDADKSGKDLYRILDHVFIDADGHAAFRANGIGKDAGKLRGNLRRYIHLAGGRDAPNVTDTAPIPAIAPSTTVPVG